MCISPPVHEPIQSQKENKKPAAHAYVSRKVAKKRDCKGRGLRGFFAGADEHLRGAQHTHPSSSNRARSIYPSGSPRTPRGGSWLRTPLASAIQSKWVSPPPRRASGRPWPRVSPRSRRPRRRRVAIWMGNLDGDGTEDGGDFGWDSWSSGGGCCLESLVVFFDDCRHDLRGWPRWNMG
jgi:hypothetical protein